MTLIEIFFMLALSITPRGHLLKSHTHNLLNVALYPCQSQVWQTELVDYGAKAFSCQTQPNLNRGYVRLC